MSQAQLTSVSHQHQLSVLGDRLANVMYFVVCFVCCRVRKQVVNIPSFVVRLDSQKHIDFSLKSPFGGGRAGRVKRKNLKKGTGGGGGGDEEDED
jgi:hypothetical protein